MSPFRILFLALGLMPAMVLAEDVPLTVEGAWVRALPPTQPNTAAYLTVFNAGEQAVIITGAASPVAGRVEIHTTREVDGYMRMEQLSTLEVAPGGQQALGPGGTHLMLLELERMPKPGESVALCLFLASGQQFCTDAPVHKDAQAEEHQHHNH